MKFYQFSLLGMFAATTFVCIGLWCFKLTADTLKQADYFKEPPSFGEVKTKRNQEQVRKLAELQNAKP